MTTPNPEPEETTPTEPAGENAETLDSASTETGGETPVDIKPPESEEDARKRRLLLVLLLLLLLLCCCAGYFIFRYMVKPQPIPEMIPVVNEVYYPPTYKFSFPLDKPVGVAVSPDNQRIYAVESGGDRLIKMFDRNGKLVDSFSPPFTTKANRTLTYAAVDAQGRLFVVDSYNDVIGLFDKDGNFLDGIIDKDVTLSKFVTEQEGGTIPKDTKYYYDVTTHSVVYQLPDQEIKSVPLERPNWAVIGVRFDKNGDLLVTNTTAGKHEVIIFPAASIKDSWLNFSPQIKEFGEEGKENGQLSFPNTAVTDKRGYYYVSDSNNGRISLWTPDLEYKTFFGFGSTENALNLPHGIWMDAKDRLHVADAVGAAIRVYDVTGDEPTFLASIGLYGTAEGEFNFPNDICIDGTGRLYIADRENNRIQVWSY